VVKHRRGVDIPRHFPYLFFIETHIGVPTVKTPLTPAEIATRVNLINANMGVNLQRITHIERDFAFCDAYGAEAEIEFTTIGGEVIITGVFDRAYL
jgi:hypothetical protein